MAVVSRDVCLVRIEREIIMKRFSEWGCWEKKVWLFSREEIRSLSNSLLA